MSVGAMSHAGSSSMAMKVPVASDAPGMAAMTSQPGHSMSYWQSLPGFAGMWSLMLLVMMTPLLIGPLRYLGERSLARRRWRARVLFVVPYAAVWVVAGAVLLPFADGLDHRSADAATAIALGVAVLWQASPAKQRCLNRHHGRPPLPAFRWAADVAALWYGARQGVSCVGSCWALMLVPLVVTADQIAVMAAVSVWIWAEQLETPRRAAWRLLVPTKALRLVRGLPGARLRRAPELA